MTESIHSDRDVDVDDDLREARDDVARTADRAADKAGDATERAKDATVGTGHKVSDAIEDMIPGDSDHDGH